MTGVDTNVLIRYLAEDDHEQTQRVHGILRAARTSKDVIYLSNVVLCEAAWVLCKVYGWEKSRMLDDFERLLETDVFVIEEEDAVRDAVGLCREGRGDFADYLMGRLNLLRGCRTTVTFDRALRTDPAFQVL